MTEAFRRPLTEKTAKQAKHAILRGTLLQMRRLNPRSEDAKETYNGRLMSLQAENQCAHHLFCCLASAINGAVEHRASTMEPLHRQRARDWLDALDAYLDRKYPETEKPCQTEPSAPAGAKGTSGAPTPLSDADVAASGCASTEDPGLAPDDPCGNERVGVDRIAFVRAYVPYASYHWGRCMAENFAAIADELAAHRKALKRAGLLKP